MGAIVAFFLGNPTLNPAVLVFLVLTLGWQWATLRLILGIGLVFGGAILASLVTSPRPPAAVQAASTDAETGTTSATGARSWYLRWLRSLTRLSVWLLPEYVVLVAVLGAARAFLFPTVAPEFGNDPRVVLGFAIAGVMFAIPTAGEIPIIQTLRLAGLPAGPAGALLLTLAPVSLPSLVMVSRVLPARVLGLLAALTVMAGLIAALAAVSIGF